MKNPITLLLITGAIIPAWPQAREKAELHVSRASHNIKIDGVLEDAWSAAPQTSSFLNKWPSDTGLAVSQTIVKMLYDNENLYVSAVNYQKKSDLVIQGLKRDQVGAFWGSDSFSVLIDPMNQRSTAFLFGVNAGGAQMEAAINMIGSWPRTNENWDNKWFSATTIHDDHWVAEMAIPFSALRFKEGSREWGLNFIRSDMKLNNFSTWSHVPVQLYGTDLGHLGSLRFNDDFSPRSSRLTIVPYLVGAHSRNHEESEDARGSVDAGVDIKLAVSSSLNLDLTWQPDFSNAEVDRQVTNVTRFSLLFPERRNFFLENADLFSNFGSWLVRPFFSRRIGLHDGQPVPILAGARLSGNVTRNTRIGIMDIQTRATDDLPANNFLVTAVEQRIFGRSAIKIFGGNRQQTGAREGNAVNEYNRTYGSEFQYTSNNGKWSGSLRAHSAYGPDKLDDRSYLSAQAGIISTRFYTGLLSERVGENYENNLGFIPRLYNYDPVTDSTYRIGHVTLNPWFGLLIYPKNSRLINMIEPNTWSVVNYRNNGEFLERNTSVNLSVLFRNTAQLFFESVNTSANLPFPADLVDSPTPIPERRYDFTHNSIKYTTDSRKAFSGDASIGYGDFYNGTRLEYGASLNFRVQPWGLFAVSYMRNEIVLPAEYGRATFDLFAPRAEVSLRNNIWWTTFLQYNTQKDNFNINSRVQWRYRPMSDLFVVYTDNYAASDLKVRNRGIVFKLTYWLNI